jgi:aryl-alcohol dehydrogenase-like predicted oxidoreductase
MENGMQTVIRGASQLQVTRSHMASGSSAATGDRWTSRLPVEAVQPPYHLFRRGIEAGLLPYAAAHPHHLQERVGALDLAPSRDDLAEIDSIMAAAVPLGGPSPEGMT